MDDSRVPKSRQTPATPNCSRVGQLLFKLATQAESDNSICFGGRRWGSHLRRKDRANSFANRESLSLRIITHVFRHNEASESGCTTTPWPVGELQSQGSLSDVCSGSELVARFQVAPRLSTEHLAHSRLLFGSHELISREGEGPSK